MDIIRGHTTWCVSLSGRVQEICTRQSGRRGDRPSAIRNRPGREGHGRGAGNDIRVHQGSSRLSTTCPIPTLTPRLRGTTSLDTRGSAWSERGLKRRGEGELQRTFFGWHGLVGVVRRLFEALDALRLLPNSCMMRLQSKRSHE